MFRIRWLSAWLALATGFACSAAANAGWFGHDNPPPSYSPFRYWTPALARIHDHFHGPSLNVYPPDRHPEIEPDYKILQYPHPAVDPAATIIEPTTPPASSKFKY
jgi:hypothetical protein